MGHFRREEAWGYIEIYTSVLIPSDTLASSYLTTQAPEGVREFVSGERIVSAYFYLNLIMVW